jgi:hypothetical protein
VLLMVSGDGSPQRLAQSVPRSRTMQSGCLVAIVSFFLGVVWHWFFVLVLLGPWPGQQPVDRCVRDCGRARRARALSDRRDGVVEVATGVNDRELRSLDRLGREIAVRDLHVKALSARQLRRELGEPSDWHELRTDEPSD